MRVIPNKKVRKFISNFISITLFFLITPTLLADWFSWRTYEKRASVKSPKQKIDKVRELLNSYLSQLKIGGVAIIRHKQAVYALNPHAVKGHRIEEYHNKPMLIGSLSKSWTAMAIAILVQEGKISFDQPLCAVMKCPKSFLYNPTLRQLLNHTAGVPREIIDPILLIKLSLNRPLTIPSNQDLVERILNSRWSHPPGLKYQYSNSGYALLAYVVEVVSGIKYIDFLQKNIAHPLGITSLESAVQPARFPDLSLEDLALPCYQNTFSPYYLTYVHNKQSINTIPHLLGAGDLLLTVGDLLKFSQAWSRNKILNQEIRRELLRPAKESYGMGVVIESTTNNNVIYWHNGRSKCYESLLLHIPDQSFSFAFLTHSSPRSEDGKKMNKNLLRLLKGLPYEVINSSPAN